MAPLNAGAAADPFVAGIEGLLEIGIGYDLGGQMRTGAADALIDQ
jgi:hypothetical protein